jgi:hypothetical protein
MYTDIVTRWKGKGKQSEAPPPYEPGEWVQPTPEPNSDKTRSFVPVPEPDPCDYPETNTTSPSLRQRRPRHVAGRRTAPRHRKVPTRTQPAHAHTINFSPPPPSHAPIPPEFNFASPAMEEDTEADPSESDQMDWIGDRLSRLIEEGKRALGKEIVVMSESKEDEEDDGSGQWIEEDGQLPSSSSGTFRHSRSKRPRSITVSSPPPQYTSKQTTPRTPQTGRFESQPGSAVSSPGRRSRAGSVESARSWTTTHHEDESAWQSPDLREAMERARQSYLQRKQMSMS